MVTTLKEVIVYTDGGCDPNPGRGAYGVVLMYGRNRREVSGGFRLTTNNRMELYAVIRSLECLKEQCKVLLHCDSQYVVRAMQAGAAKKWKARDFRGKGGRLIPNADLWDRLLIKCQEHEVEFRWVKGHNGNALNERCDELAAIAMQLPDMEIDEVYESARKPDSEIPLTFGEKENAIMADDLPTEPIEKQQARSGKIIHEGQLCRKCSTPVVKRIPRKKPKPGQDYYFEYYLFCPGCSTIYMVDEAKHSLVG